MTDQKPPKRHSHYTADSDGLLHFGRDPYADPHHDDEVYIQDHSEAVVHEYIDHAGRPTRVLERGKKTDLHSGDDQVAFFAPGPVKTKWLLTEAAERLADRPHSSDVAREARKLQDDWKAAGTADRSTESVLHPRFRAAIDRVFANRQQAWDENRRRKEQVVAEARSAASGDLRAASQTMRLLMDRWKQVGPAARSDDERLWQEFNAIRSDVAGRPSAERQQREAVQARNKNDKERLVSRARDAVRLDGREGSNVMRTLMDEWKRIGPAGRADDERLWRDFSSARTALRERQERAHAEREAEYARARSVKQGLLSRARSTAEATDLRSARDEMRRLMDQWKNAGNAGKADNDRLWKEFDAARTRLRTRGEQERRNREQEWVRNRTAKESLVSQMRSLSSSSDFRVAKDQARALTDRWKAVGPCAKADNDRLWDAFKAAKDILFQAAKDSAARRAAEYVQRAREALARAEDGVRRAEESYSRALSARSVSMSHPKWYEISAKQRERQDQARQRLQEKQIRRGQALERLMQAQARVGR